MLELGILVGVTGWLLLAWWASREGRRWPTEHGLLAAAVVVLVAAAVAVKSSFD